MMMSGDGELAKILLPYIHRANEIRKYEPLVAYYCRLYAMDRGLKIPPKERSKTINVLLVSLMKQLEKDKKSVRLSSEDNLYVEGFATRVFMKADKQERRGKADLNTAKTFYAASLFFEILHNFGDVPFDLEQKQKYAAWKAAVIRKALKKGSKPSVGLPASDKALSISDGGLSGSELHSEEVADDSPELRFPLEQSSALGSKGDVVQEQIPFSTIHFCDTAVGPTMSTTDSNQQDSSDDDEQTFHDCYQEAEHSVLSSSHFGGGLDDTISASAVQEQFPFSTIQFCDNRSDPRLIFDTAGSPTMSTTSNSNQQDAIDDDEFFYDCSQEADDSVLLSSSFGSGLDSTISASADVQGRRYHPSAAEVAKAHKASRFAVSALAFDDVPSAVSYLKQALDLLTNHSQNR